VGERERVERAGERVGLVRLGDVLVPQAVTLYTGDVEDKGAPNVTARFEVRDGRPECVQLTVTAMPGGRGIRLRDLEVFTLDATVEAAFARFGIRPDDPPATLERPDASRELTAAEVAQLEQLRRTTRGEVKAARRGRPRTPVDQLARAAEVYREHIDGQPTKAVALVLGLSHRTAARRVQQARAAGLLPPTTRGLRKV
jgi:hypothetical protein